MPDQVWLRTNARGLLLNLVPVSVLGAIGVGACWVFDHWLAKLAGGLTIALATAFAGFLLWLSRQPRLATQGDVLLVYVRGAKPVHVPLEIVECFLLGQGPSSLGGKQHERTESKTVVIRLSERATEWSRLPANPVLGKWCEGHVTLYGTWCEPLDVSTVNRLNAQLHEAKQALRQPQAVS